MNPNGWYNQTIKIKTVLILNYVVIKIVFTTLNT